MPKAKKKTGPGPYVWVILDPDTGLYFKQTSPTARTGWFRKPFVFTSEKHLLSCVDWLKAFVPNAQVVPYVLNIDYATDIGRYGQ